MAKLKFNAPYSLSVEKIREKVETGARKFGAKADWKKDDECHFDGEYKGFKVSGFFKVKAKEVEVSLNLPFVAIPFKGKIQERVIQELNKN